MAEEAWLTTAPLQKIPGLPDFGWRVRLDHEFKETCKPFTIPRLHQIPGLVGLSLRYMQLWFKKKREGKRLFIDNIDLVPWKPIYGVPIGGIGCGTIGRGYRGEFCRFQMIPGMYKYHTVLADQFTVCIRRRGKTIYQQVLSPHRPEGGALGAWNWAFSAEHAWYHGLYPRSWTVYDLPGQNVRLICRQVSPIFPHDYKDTSFPGAVFIWTVENNLDEAVEVSIMFTFQNGQGEKADSEGGVWNEPFCHKDDQHPVSGVMIHQTLADMQCTYALAGKHKKGVHVSHCVGFDPKSSGKDLWMDLMEDGRLNSQMGSTKVTLPGKHLAAAVCCQCLVEPHQSNQVEMSLTWDMPVIHFGGRETMYCRRYSRWFGNKGDASPQLSSYALYHYESWEDKINQWQDPILKSSRLPAWYKSALFNELYFVSDGGTVWVDPVDDDPDNNTGDTGHLHPLIKEYGRFAYLEGHEYRMYNTYDVHHYASFALIMLWPKLQISLQYDIAASIQKEQSEMIRYCMTGAVDQSKSKNSVPHDIGDPDDEPWKRVNAYVIHPTQEWKDLNTKFILQVYRDYVHIKDLQFLRDMYPHTKAVMEHSLRWDIDGDGLIDNSGFADQTYDAWPVTGASAYCGGMWLAAVRMFCEMAKLLGHQEDQDKFQAVLNKGMKSYEEKLWNGEYYNYDSSTSGHHDSIHSDQLAGHWFLNAAGVTDEIFPKDHVKSVLKSIFKWNVMPFRNGTIGAINGMRPDFTKDTTSCQSEEFWTGVVYAVGSLMMQEGMLEQGFQTAYGAYHACYEWLGLQYQTPEAYYEEREYRSLGYMRPLCIWSIQHAIEHFQPHLMK